MGRQRHSQEFEGKDIMYYLEHPEECEKLVEGITDDELTKGRIRTIYAKVVYGQSSIKEMAEYYDLPEALIRDIAKGNIFKEITSQSFDMED